MCSPCFASSFLSHTTDRDNVESTVAFCLFTAHISTFFPWPCHSRMFIWSPTKKLEPRLQFHYWPLLILMLREASLTQAGETKAIPVGVLGKVTGQDTWWGWDHGDNLELMWSHSVFQNVFLCFLAYQTQWDDLTIFTGHFRKQLKKSFINEGEFQSNILKYLVCMIHHLGKTYWVSTMCQALHVRLGTLAYGTYPSPTLLVKSHRCALIIGVIPLTPIFTATVKI